MAKKEVRLLLACESKKLQANLLRRLRTVYTVTGAKDLRDLSHQLKIREHSLVIVDHTFGGLDVEDLEQKINRFCHNIVFIVYSEAERKAVAKALKRYRAVDYILYTPRLHDMIEKFHKAIRWTLLQNDVTGLSQKITRVAESIKTLSRKIEKMYH